jgi:hypothetical protein
MESYNFVLLFFVVWIILIPTLLFGFSILHSLFMVMKENDENLWSKLGRPYCKIGLPFNISEVSIPTNVVTDIYKWVFFTPEWAGESKKGRDALRNLRFYFVFNGLVALALLYSMYFVLMQSV